MTRQERSRRPGRLGTLERLEARDLMTIAATAPLPNLSVTAGAVPAQVNLGTYFKDPAAAPNFAMVNTSLGTIPVLLTPKTTPLTVANFTSYVTKGSYTNAVVHRSVPGFIWQTGGYQLNAGGNGVTPIAADAPVKNEFGASNVRGTIAMAKLGSNPNSATNQFFFNESDANASNLDNQNGGFTVFGRVIGAQGLAVMDAVAAVPAPSPGPLASPLDQVPLQNYTAGQPVGSANLVLIKDVTLASELYLTASSAPGVAVATVQGTNLAITPVGAGTAQITVQGFGSDGVPAAQSFVVTVAANTDGTTTTTTMPPAGTDPTDIATTTPPAGVPPTTTTVVAANPSALIPAARGAVPASVVAGGKARIQQTVSLLNPSGTVAQRERVTLRLSPTTTGTASDLVIAGATAQVKLRAGQRAQVKLSSKPINAAVPAGTYHLLVAVTDPSGATTTVATGKTLTVRAAKARA